MKLVFFVGNAGVGKTTVSTEVAKLTNVVYLDKDVIGKHYMDKLFELMNMNPNDRDSDFYKKQFRDIEYNAIKDIAAQNLLLGNDVYVVAPFNKEISNKNWIDNYLTKNGLSRKNVVVKVVVVTIDDERIQKERIHNRNASRDEWKLNNWNEYRKNLKKTTPVKWNISSDHILIFNNSFELNDQKMNELIVFLK